MKFRMVVSSLAAVCIMYLYYGVSNHRRSIVNIDFTSRPQVNVQVEPQRPTIELAFVLDTTGSMTGMIDTAKQTIWRIVNQVMRADCRPIVRVGLVAYRDHGDVYVTKVSQITGDLDSIYTELMTYQAAGGGDRPEDVRQALADGVHKLGWSRPAPNLAQLMFLVGDSPPHDDYTDEPSCLKSAEEAAGQGIVVNAIECGDAADTKADWQAIAGRAQGKFFAIAQDGGPQQVSTPYDGVLSHLGGMIGETYYAYGGSAAGSPAAAIEFQANETRAKSRMEHEALSSAAGVSADRAVNKAINAAPYTNDLVSDVESHRVDLNTVKTEDLPEEMQRMTVVQRQAEITSRICERQQLRQKILDLAHNRDAFLRDAQKKQGGVGQTFDADVNSAIRLEAAAKGVQL